VLRESRDVSRAFPSWERSILTEIHLCHACSCQEILRMDTPGQATARSHPRAASSQRLAGQLRRELRTIFRREARRMEATFEGLDTNGDGVLSAGEFRRGLQQLDIGLTVQQAEDLLMLIDTNGSGTIDYAEFADMFGDDGAEERLVHGALDARACVCLSCTHAMWATNVGLIEAPWLVNGGHGASLCNPLDATADARASVRCVTHASKLHGGV
jgi:hypothetical protein